MPVQLTHIAYLTDGDGRTPLAVTRDNPQALADALEALAAEALSAANALRVPGGAA